MSERRDQAKTIFGWVKTLAFGEADDVIDLGKSALDDANAQRAARRAGLPAAGSASSPPRAPASAPPPAPRRTSPAPHPGPPETVLNKGCQPPAGDVQPTAEGLAVRRELSTQILNGLRGPR
jgi:hypothetical protein